jgi:hypothetical protein
MKLRLAHLGKPLTAMVFLQRSRRPSFSLRTALFIPASFSVLALGCTQDAVVDPAPPLVAVASVAPEKRSAEQVDSLAKGLALALGNQTVRLSLRDALRDSPFHLHAVELGSYLRGSEGSRIAAKAAAAIGVPAEAFLNMADSNGTLELVMPRALDRISWDGNAEIDVTATVATLGERIKVNRVSQPGYDLRGAATSVITLRYSPRPYIILRPAERIFPSDPEVVRTAAPKHDWKTVTTPAGERFAMRQNGKERVAREKGSGVTINTIPTDCDPVTGECPVGSGGGGGTSVGGGGATLPSEMTKSYCYGVSSPLNATTDRDSDGVRDTCEDALASRLAPLLNIGVGEPVPARQPYWALSKHPDRPGNVQIIYALSYLKDNGYGVPLLAHSGDSEFIILEIANASNSTWGVRYASLSAHFGAEEGVPPESQSGLDTYYFDDLDYPQGPFPRIWSALGKHANYRNRAACESGAFYFDTCNGTYYGAQISAPSWRNLGNFFHVPAGTETTSTQLLDCTSWEGPAEMYGAARTSLECFWSETSRFSGWDSARPDQVTPYRQIFRIFEF